MELVFAFLAGSFLTNSVPHIVSGIIGHKHMTPFAKESTAMVNIFWGYLNLLFGAWFMNQSGRDLTTVLSFDSFSMSFLIGSFAIAIIAAWLFSNPNSKFPWFK